jgi:hypothetical protein
MGFSLIPSVVRDLLELYSVADIVIGKEGSIPEAVDWYPSHPIGI